MSKLDDPRSGYISLRFPEAELTVDTISQFLGELVRTDPRNALPEGDNVPIWEEPVVGIADAADPLFDTLREPRAVGPYHVKPDFWLPEAKSVISFFLPFSKEIKRSYERSSILPSLEWVSGRLNGEVFVNVARRALVRLLERQGGNAIIPNLDLRYGSQGFIPNWSERHVAFVAGVGTFGLHAGLLTKKGAAGRVGSVVTDIPLPATKRPYTEVYEYCLWHFDRSCHSCIPRCPVNAIDENGKDHVVCTSNGRINIRPEFQEWGYHSCGHCQTHLPCSDRIPPKIARHLARNAGE
ncbi:MAG TPA: epoxyqueuosine reductase [Rhodospirillaceae bacterium]|nr:epoxyqueuosine reductase [Rhodospirillaceae bacterium]